MSASSYLKASVCLTLLVLLSASTNADVTSACHSACSGPEGQPSHFACVLKCQEIVSKIMAAENEEEYEEEDYPMEDGLGSTPEEAAQLRVSQPFQVMSRNDRAMRRANLLLNRFVRYGRNQAETLRKTGQRRPNYLRVGRRSDELNGGDFDDVSKRASRFVRIGKSGVYEDDDARDIAQLQDVGFRSSQYEVDKKNKRPSKYVRIGKRGDDTSLESGHQKAEA